MESTDSATIHSQATTFLPYCVALGSLGAGSYPRSAGDLRSLAMLTPYRCWELTLARRPDDLSGGGFRMKKLLLCAGLVFATPATAEDWSGWYVGGDAGVAMHRLYFDNVSWLDFPATGPAAGLVVGYWATVGDALLGWDVRAAIGGASYDESGSFEEYGVTVTPFGNVVHSVVREVPYRSQVRQDGSITARAKMGMPFDGLLVYAAAGPSVVMTTSIASFDGVSTTDHDVSLGITGAIGAEKRIGENLSIAAEYGFELSNMNLSGDNSGTDAGWGVGGMTAKAGLNFHF